MSDTAITGLREQVRGEVLEPGDPGYDEARAVYNGMHDRRPLAVIRCADAADVRAAVTLAAERGLDLAVKGGGHSVPGFGTCEGGIVADLSPMRWVRVDPEARTARVGGGATWGDFDHAAHAYGLATTGGIISTTGVAGLTLGGGIGYLARRHGLSCDNLLSADVVTADGRLLTASAHQNADLFWALRGGGGNFGVVTSLEFQLHPVSTIVGGPMFFDIADAGDVLEFYGEFVSQAPEELGIFFGFHQAPPLPFIPEERHFRPHCALVACWTGAPDEAERVLKPARDVAPIVGEHVGPAPYPALNSAFDPLLGPGLQHYWKADYVPRLTAPAIAAHVEHGRLVPSVQTAVHIYPIDGAVHRVGPEETAFAHRDMQFAAVIAGMWENPADNERNTRWVRDYWSAIHPHSAPGGYINFMAEDDQDRVRDNYGTNYDRLAAVKADYDPGNVFHLNQNIAPAR